MSSWLPPVGQGEEFDRLVRQARARRMHHGLLITGARGIGKSMTADYLARALLCAGSDPAAPCDLDGSSICSSCKHIAIHPDLRRVEIPLEDREKKEEIPVGLVRELCDSLQRASVQGRARVVIVEPGDRLNIQGQNALLKTMEEPGRNTFLLLPTRRPEGLLETVRSRVSELRILPLPIEVLDRMLVEVAPDPADRTWITTHSEGSYGWARELAHGEIRPLFELVQSFVHGGHGTPVTVARAALEGVSGRMPSVDRVRLVLWMVRTILRKELLTALAPESPGPYSDVTSVRCTTKIETLFDAETDLSLRIPPEQVLANAFATLRS